MEVQIPKISVLSSSMVHPWYGSIIPNFHTSIGSMAVFASMETVMPALNSQTDKDSKVIAAVKPPVAAPALRLDGLS